MSLQGTSAYSSRSTWQKASALAAPSVKNPVPGISSRSPAPPATRDTTVWCNLKEPHLCLGHSTEVSKFIVWFIKLKWPPLGDSLLAGAPQVISV